GTPRARVTWASRHQPGPADAVSGCTGRSKNPPIVAARRSATATWRGSARGTWPAGSGMGGGQAGTAATSRPRGDRGPGVRRTASNHPARPPADPIRPGPVGGLVRWAARGVDARRTGHARGPADQGRDARGPAGDLAVP